MTLIYFLMIMGCTPVDGDIKFPVEEETTNQDPLPECKQEGQDVMISARDSVRFEEIINVPWGAEGGIPELFVETPQMSLMTDKAPRQMRAPVRLRVTPWGWIDILAYDPAYSQGMETRLYRFSPQGKLMSQVEILPPSTTQAGWRILDFLTDETGYIYLLETFQVGSASRNHLRKLTPEGRPIWSRSGSFATDKFDLNNLEGDFQQLLIDGSSVPYLAATRHRGLVARIDADNGNLEPYADWGTWMGEVFMDGDGRIYYVRYLPDAKTRCWAYYDPASQKEFVTTCDENLYGLLALPIAVDAQGQGYAVSGMCLGRITNGSLTWQAQIDNMVLQPEKNVIYTSNFKASDTGGEVQVGRWQDGGSFEQQVELALPLNLKPEQRGGWRLVYLDSEGAYQIYGGETPRQAGMLMLYSSQGIMQDQINPAPDIHLVEYRLQAGRSWAVDLEGNIYLPLLGPTGFHVVKMIPL